MTLMAPKGTQLTPNNVLEKSMSREFPMFFIVPLHATEKEILKEIKLDNTAFQTGIAIIDGSTGSSSMLRPDSLKNSGASYSAGQTTSKDDKTSSVAKSTGDIVKGQQTEVNEKTSQAYAKSEAIKSARYWSDVKALMQNKLSSITSQNSRSLQSDSAPVISNTPTTVSSNAATSDPFLDIRAIRGTDDTWGSIGVLGDIKASAESIAASVSDIVTGDFIRYTLINPPSADLAGHLSSQSSTYTLSNMAQVADSYTKLDAQVESAVNVVFQNDADNTEAFVNAIYNQYVDGNLSKEQSDFIIDNASLVMALWYDVYGGASPEQAAISAATLSSYNAALFDLVQSGVSDVLYNEKILMQQTLDSVTAGMTTSEDALFPYKAVIRMPFAPTDIFINNAPIVSESRVRGGFNIDQWGHKLPIISLKATTSYFQIETWKYKLLEVLKEFTYNRKYVTFDKDAISPSVNEPFFTRPMISLYYDGLEYEGYISKFNWQITANAPFKIDYDIDFVVTKLPDAAIQDIIAKNTFRLW